MNKKGFTLVEVLAALAITSLLLLILVPNVFIMINKNNEKSCKNIINNIESATKMYVTNNKYDLGFGCDEPNNTKEITLQTLVDNGFLTLESEGKIINPVTDIEIPLTTKVEVTYNCSTKEFLYEVKDIKCEKNNNSTNDENNTNNNDDNNNEENDGNNDEEILPEDIEDQEKIAQAIYSADDNSLTFVKTHQLNNGDIYNGKTVTEVYTGFETAIYNYNFYIPWYSYRKNITSVMVQDTISPISTKYWFDSFEKCAYFDLKNLKTSYITDMTSMFSKCKNLTNLDVSNWDTSNVVYMNEMFSGCNNLTNLDVSNWDTSNVIKMHQMFSSCNNLTNLDVSNWDTSNVTNMNNMFSGCNNLTNLDVSNWNTSKVTNMNYMFQCCHNLIELDVSNWDTSNVVYMNEMFTECNNLIKLDVSNWNTSKVTNMFYMFVYCVKLTELDVSNWDTSNVIDMHGMFAECSNLTELDVSNWDTSNVIDMHDMFGRANNLKVDCSTWNVAKVTNHDSFNDNAPGVIEPNWVL